MTDIRPDNFLRLLTERFTEQSSEDATCLAIVEDALADPRYERPALELLRVVFAARVKGHRPALSECRCGCGCPPPECDAHDHSAPPVTGGYIDLDPPGESAERSE